MEFGYDLCKSSQVSGRERDIQFTSRDGRAWRLVRGQQDGRPVQ